jgi:pimeloyl-ACP methyl ester carboxylesterase
MKTNPTGTTGDTAIYLRDGRRLAMLEVGKSEGFPLFHFHGTGSSRLEVLTVQSVAERLGVRLVSLYRPGIGGSDERRGYRLLDWPDDVVEVADQLGIERFAVEGLCGGAPFALACAFENLFLWQGEQDPIMPAARLLAQALPHCTATFYPNEGHLSTFVNHAQEIWKALSTAHAPEQ